MTDEEWMRERKAVTNIVGQLPLSSVCLCTCHVSDTIIVYIKAESWVHRMSIFTASTERPIGILTMTTTHFPPPPPPFFLLAVVYLFWPVLTTFFLCRFRLIVERTNNCGWKSNLSWWIYTQKASSTPPKLTQLFQITKRFKMISLFFCYWFF